MVATAAAVIGAIGTAAGAAKSIFGGNPQGAAQQGLSQQELEAARANQIQQSLITALANQRAVAGSSDSFGTTLRYDPATNTWVSQLGPLPEAAQRASDQAGITRNTTDLQQVELANREAARRAALAAPAADTAQRNLQTFRPMSQDQLVGLLQDKATTAANLSYRPLIEDTLRTFARTGTAAGPVLAKIGQGEADNLRRSLIDAQISGMTATDQVNNSRRQALESTAANTAALANPSFQASGITPSTASSALATLLGSRANNAGFVTEGSGQGANTAAKLTTDAFGNAIKNVTPPSNGLTTGLGQISDFLKSDNAKTLLNLFGSSSSNPTSLPSADPQGNKAGF